MSVQYTQGRGAAKRKSDVLMANNRILRNRVFQDIGARQKGALHESQIP